jgi:hypothetical protein
MDDEWMMNVRDGREKRRVERERAGGGERGGERRKKGAMVSH